MSTVLPTKKYAADNNFNLLRLIAAFLVVVSHSYGLLNMGAQQPGIQINDTLLIPSDFGLYIFFTISGYLVTKSLQASNSFFHYAKKRMVRIWPALALACLFCIIMGACITHLPIISYLLNANTWLYFFINISLIKNQFTLPGVFTSLQNDSVNASIWTILLEVRFYLLLALASSIKLLQKKWLLFILFLFLQILRGYAAKQGLVFAYIDWGVYLLYGSYFYMGMLFVFFPEWLNIRPIWWTLILVLAFWTPTPFNMIIVSFSLPYFILQTGLFRSIVPLKGIDVSYGLYLYAFPVQQILIYLMGYDTSVWVHIMLSTSIAILAALFSWFIIEKPALQYK